MGEVIVYESAKGKTQVEVRLQEETVWLTQKQMADIFGKDVRTVSEHIQNIFKERELEAKSVIRNFRITATDGKMYDTKYYNLDAIISVGYRVKSKQGTQFRIWATQILKQHIVKGFTINEKRLKEQQTTRLKELESAVSLLQKTIQRKQLTDDESKGLLRIITDYTQSWILLHKYDQGSIGLTDKGSRPTQRLEYTEAKAAIDALKKQVLQRKEAGDLFGQERKSGLESILKNLEQTFDGKALYPSIEEKAANLLYFVIKDHPFVDGNKRTGALLFILFLAKNNRLISKKGERVINENALTALALLVAESNPKERQTMIGLIFHLLK